MWQLASHLLLWSQKHLRSLRAIHIPGMLNHTADELSRQPALPGEWRLHPQVVQLIWGLFGASQVDLFASPDSTHCQLFYSLTEGTLGTDVSLLAQTLCNVREDWGAGPVSCTILAQPDLVLGIHAPRDSPSLAHSSEEGPAFSETRLPLAPMSRPLEASCLVPRWDAEVLGDLPQSVVNTINSARAPSTRHLYALKWNLFIDWCSSQREDPWRCPVRVMLSFLHEGLDRRLSPSTLKVYVAAIAAHHEAVDGKYLGKHDLVVRFLRGARRLNSPRPTSVPSWDLSLVLMALQRPPFEPLQSAELKIPTTPFRDQVVSLQALPSEEADPALAFLCPVCTLRLYVDRTQSFRTSYQLFVCYGGQQKGKAVSKQRLAHWIVDAIVLWIVDAKTCLACSGCKHTQLEVLLPPGCWLKAPRWQIQCSA